jgi:lipoyl(octanoyl) transferase
LSALAALEAGPELADVEVRRAAETDVLLLLQHRSVYTTGRRETDAAVLEAEGRRLRALGADYVATERGGQTTYHGPGQLVGYPIFNMAATGVRHSRYWQLCRR